MAPKVLHADHVDGCVQEFYEISNKHRKLTWIYALGTCNVSANFDARTIDLVLTTFQATLLLLFNDGVPSIAQLICLCGCGSKHAISPCQWAAVQTLITDDASIIVATPTYPCMVCKHAAHARTACLSLTHGW